MKNDGGGKCKAGIRSITKEIRGDHPMHTTSLEEGKEMTGQE